MITSKTIQTTQDVTICDRCKLDPNPAPVHSIFIKLGSRKRADGVTVRGDLCEDCLAILFKSIGIIIPVVPPESL